MPLTIHNVVVDCEDPQRLAEFWTRALEMTVLEDHGSFVQLGRADSPVGLGLQRVPEPRAGKNRVHIDLHGEPRAAAAERLVALGATVHGEERPPGLDLVWTVLTDPDGNEFCIGGDTGIVRAAPGAAVDRAAAIEAVRGRYERTAADDERIVSTAESTFFRGCRAWACAAASGDVLDLAAGTGRNLPLLTAAPAVTSVSAIDLSPAMLDLARHRPGLGDTPVTYQVADAAELPCADGSFDTVVAALAMDVVPDPAAVLAEVVRVLRPGGQFVAFHYVAHPRPAARAIQRAIEPLTWRFQGIRLTRDPRRLLAEAGLELVESSGQAGGWVLRYRAIRPSEARGE